jgi:hypothetical protein
MRFIWVGKCITVFESHKCLVKKKFKTLRIFKLLIFRYLERFRGFQLKLKPSFFQNTPNRIAKNKIRLHQFPSITFQYAH